MQTFLQKMTAQLPERFYKKPVEKIPPQNSTIVNSRKKTILAALATFSAFGAGYFTYLYSKPKINIPVAASTIGTAFKVVGSLMGLAATAGVLSYHSSKGKSEKETNLISPKSTKSQPILNNKNKRKTSDRSNDNKHNHMNSKFNGFNSKELIDKNLLEELITKNNDPSKVSPEAINSNINFISDIIDLLKYYKSEIYRYNTSLDEKKSIFIKIIDILDVLTGRTDTLSCRLVKNLFSYMIPNGLHEMIQVFIELEDTEYNKLVDRSCQLTYKILNQQLKIFYSDGINFETDMPDKAFSRILELLTPFKKDDFRLSPNFYTNFIQYSPKLAWRFIQKHIFEYVINVNNELSSNIDLLPDIIIADFLNAREAKNDNNEDKSFSRYANEDGFNILKKIVKSARRSLFLDDRDQEAASFAIRLMQHKLQIDPKEFEKNHPNGSKLLKELYFELCSQKDINFFKNFAKEKGLIDLAATIANALINEYERGFEKNHLLGSEETKTRLSFLQKIAPLYRKQEYSDEEKKIIQHLTYCITSTIRNLSAHKVIKLASLALDKYSEVFQNVESVNLIREAYHKSQVSIDPDLDSACQKFLKNWNASNEAKSELINEKPKPTHSDIVKLFNEFHAEEKINKDLLEELINTYNDLDETSPETTFSNETIISDINKLVEGYLNDLFKDNIGLEVQKSNLNKIIDILDIFTGRTDLLSFRMMDIFCDRFPFLLMHLMTQTVALQDLKSTELVDRSCQLIHKTLARQMKILFSYKNNFEEGYLASKNLIKILNFLIPFEKDDPHFYANFIQNYPKIAWQFVQKYILEYLINNVLPSNIDIAPENIITNYLNTNDIHNKDKQNPQYTIKEGLGFLKKIVTDAQLALFLDDQDQEAASFAINLMQQKLKINPQKFAKNNPKDLENLKLLYFDLCNTKESALFIDLEKKYELSDKGDQIAKLLISEGEMTFITNDLFGSNVTKNFQTLITKIPYLLYINHPTSSLWIKEYTEAEKRDINKLTLFIAHQIIDPSIPVRAELASQTLEQYPKLFFNEKAIRFLKNAYSLSQRNESTCSQLNENTRLNSACQKFFEAWENLPKANEIIKTELKDSEMTDDTKEEEEVVERRGIIDCLVQ